MRLSSTVSCLWLAVATLHTGCNDTVYVVYEHHELLESDERIPAGSGCLAAIDKSWGDSVTVSGIGIGDDLQLSYWTPGDTFMVEVSTKGEVIETREYSEHKLRAGQHDPFIIKTASGKRYELDYWGADDCGPEGEGIR